MGGATVYFRVIVFIIFIYTTGGFLSSLILHGQYFLQDDFACLYTVGESLNRGLSPYINYVFHDSHVWDGVCYFRHSRYLYPPITGVLFQPLAFLPYYQAKFLWMALTLGWVTITLSIMIHMIHLKITLEKILILGIVICLFYPLRIQFEDGQIDALTLMLNFIAVKFMLGGERSRFFSGVILAISTFIKLYTAFVVPFLILRRRWRELLGFGLGIIMILCLSLIQNKSLFMEYFLVHLPRISIYGDIASSNDMYSKEEIAEYLISTRTKKPWTFKDGKRYIQNPRVSIIEDASLVNFLGLTEPAKKFYQFLAKFNLAPNGKTILSLIIYFIFYLMTILWQLAYFRKTPILNPYQELIYWQMVLIILLLSGRLTWATTTVWLLPIVLIIMNELKYIQRRDKIHWISLSGLVVLWGFLCIPDYFWIPWINKGNVFILQKYVWIEILLWIHLLVLLISTRKRETDI